MKKVYPSLLLFSLCLLSFSILAQSGEKKPTLDNWMKEFAFSSRSIQGLSSMKDGIHYSEIVNRGKAITQSSYETGKLTDTLFSVDWINQDLIPAVTEYQFNQDESKILIGTNSEAIFRHSYIADYYLFDIKTKEIIPISSHGKQQLATFSPDGSKIAFARNNNLFYLDLNTKKEIQITWDGKKNHLINGTPDWVYEEEFAFNKAFTWAPDSKTLAFIKFNESKVKEFGMTLFAGSYPELSENKLYPSNETWKYPKAGEANSVVTVHSYNLENQSTIQFELGENTDIYIPRIKWTASSNRLCIYRLNRLQNKLELLYADPESGETRVFYTDENKYFIDEGIFDNIEFLSDNKHLIIQNEQDGYTHLYLYSTEGKLINRITAGNFDVTNFLGYDPDKKLIYYQAAAISPLEREIYSIKLNGKSIKQLSAQIGWNNAQFSSNYSYFINTHTSHTSPAMVTLHQSDGKKIRVLEENTKLKERLKEYQFNYPEFFSFTTSEGVSLNGKIIKPFAFDPQKKYPVLMTQYSGPNSQQVTNTWSFGWEQVMAGLGYVVVTVDGRGTGARGEEFRKMTYLQLGKYETIDQIEAARYLQTQSFIDPDRIGIWGWSYGGYISTLCMVKSDGLFKAGIAVAPVTNWRYYDNIYTERYMRTPQENPDGYDQNSPLNFAQQLKGNYLIVHGSADDNVHVQNTMEMSDKLIQANIHFDQMIYTNRNHGIHGGNARYHLYTKKINFLLENL
jgi:dipeptidyl-peptidase 4